MDEPGTERDVGSVPPVVLAPVGKRWAVLVGVSRYRMRGFDLRYAHRDAHDLHDLIVTPEGGNFAAENIRLLCDEEATTAAVTQAVRGFLLGALPDDLVLLFFACHGGPDPRRPSGPLYLYTHDTDPRDVAGTAFAMDEIDRSLRQLVQARRVVIIADTCHSGGIGGGPGGRAAAGAEATNQYLAAMAQAKGGVALLTSAEAAEASLEDARWGGGHGVFTHYVLEGMRGAADGYRGEKDGIVSVGELFEYVRDQVQKATEGRQHPAIGTTQFDRKLPMAITGELDVAQHLALGRRLVDVGWLLDDPAPMLLAAQQFGLAADLKRRLPAAKADRGGALLAAERTDEAIAALQSAVTEEPQKLDAVASLHLAIALAERGRFDDAATTFRQFRRRTPGSDDDAWARAYIDWLERPPGRVRALLIGAGTFPADSGVMPLAGTANDVGLLARVLGETFEVGDDDIELCVDDAATAASIRDRLAGLRARVTSDDVVIVYFTGHSIDTAGPDDPFLIGHDNHRDGPIGISPTELATSLEMTAREVVLILDTHIAPSFLALVEHRKFENVTLLLACGVGEVAYEKLIDGEQHGLFTASLAAELAAAGREVAYGSLIEAVRRRVQSDRAHLGQTPQLAGHGDARAFAGRFPLAGLWRALRRQTPRESDIPVLQRAATELDDPRAWWALGRRALADGAASVAVDHLARADDRADRPEINFDIALAELDRGNPDAAADAIRKAAATVNGPRGDRLDRALSLLAQSTVAPPKICLIAPMSGFVAATMQQRVTELTADLAAAFDRSASGVEVIAIGDATVAAMRKALERHTDTTGEQVAVVVYVGAISFDEGYQYRLADGSLSAADVRAVTQGAANLVTLLELEEVRDRVVVSPTRPDYDLGFEVAAVTHDPSSTSCLIRSLRDVWVEHLTYGQWIALTQAAELVPTSAAHLSVIDRGAWMAARRQIVRAQRAAADEAARLAGDAIARRHAQHEEHPAGHLQAGLALTAARRHAKALEQLRAARNLYDDPSINRIEHARDVNAGRWHLESRYHYGRLQYEHGDDLYDAVATLRTAGVQAPSDSRILLHLVRAIRALVERESLVEARRYARRYLELGAPFGDAEALREFVAPPAVR